MKKWVDTTMEDLRNGGNLKDRMNNEVMPDDINSFLIILDLLSILKGL